MVAKSVDRWNQRVQPENRFALLLPFMNRLFLVTSCSALMCCLSDSASAAIVFDDFNASEGHFGYDPNFAFQSVGDDPSSVADRVTTDNPLEGAGHQKLILVPDGSGTPFRTRHLSGKAPFGSADAGTPAGNIGFEFQITDGVDGFIGFYLKTTATGWEAMLNLDDASGAAAEMDGSTSLSIIPDGQWHLYEWDLDSTSDWGSVPGIADGHGGALPLGQHTIDSIYFRDMDGEAGPTAEIFLDFVAKSDSGSIAALVPEPSAIGMTLLGLCGLAARRTRRA